MTGLWILIVITAGPQFSRNVTMQPFNQRTECETAGKQITAVIGSNVIRYWCAPGGRMELP